MKCICQRKITGKVPIKPDIQLLTCYLPWKIVALGEPLRGGSDLKYLGELLPSPSAIGFKGKGKQAKTPEKHDICHYIAPSRTVVNKKTIQFTVETIGIVIVVGTITTREELTNLVSKIYINDVDALDCECIAFKEGISQLQLLQVGLLVTEGNAIIVDNVDDSSMKFVSWVFKGDALVIEHNTKRIELNAILNLQVKSGPIPNVKNLNSAMRGSKKQHKNSDFSNENEFDHEAKFNENIQRTIYLYLKEKIHSLSSAYASITKAHDPVITLDESESQYSVILWMVQKMSMNPSWRVSELPILMKMINLMSMFGLDPLEQGLQKLHFLIVAFLKSFINPFIALSVS
ncbi:hypothetical protein K501DRAFT_271634 [Backusella circina FSU 941]|nr:hypothetical protein K501DRAFT_271634 [Backusella circina FSU 941]